MAKKGLDAYLLGLYVRIGCLLVELESEFDVTLEPEEIGEMKCFEDIIRILKSKGV